MKLFKLSKTILVSVKVIIFLIFIQGLLRAEDSLYIQNQNSSTISIGIGTLIYESGSDIESRLNLSMNLDLKITKVFFIKAGVDLFEHHSWGDTKGILYLGPNLRFYVFHPKINISIDLGLLGITSATNDGLGFLGAILLNPAFKYNFKNFLIGIELRNYLSSGFTAAKSNYYINPLINFSYKL